MNIQTAHLLYYASLSGAVLCFWLATLNPYRLRRYGDSITSRLLPSDVRANLRHVADAWAGRARLTESQLQLMTLVGVTGSLVVGFLMYTLLGLSGLGLGALLALLAYAFPRQYFRRGFARPLLFTLEREALLLAGFMYRARIAGMSLQIAFQNFMAAYPETDTARLLQDAPTGAAYADALLALEFPTEEVENWISVMATLATIHEVGNPKQMLASLRERVAAREAQWLRTEIKAKAFKAPVVTVLLILPGLMAVLLGAIILEAVRSLGGGGLF
jgi:hypothetical protein